MNMQYSSASYFMTAIYMTSRSGLVLKFESSDKVTE